MDSSFSLSRVKSRHSIPIGAFGFSSSSRRSRIISTGIALLLTRVILRGLELLKVVILPKSKASSNISIYGMIVLAENGTTIVFPPRISIFMSPEIVFSSTQ